MADSHEYISSLDGVKIGKNVLESLTRSAYDDCRCILREYVQNAADQIDIAKEQGLEDDEGFGIYINIIPHDRRIEIFDNATGVEAAEVLPILRNVACSQKRRTKRKGFRGIGRLGGLGYCSTLTFVTSYKGENVKSILKWNASEMTRIIDDEDDESSAGEVVARVTTLSTDTEKPELHYFQIIMEDVSDSKLLDVSDICDYLSMVAPVEIANTFMPFKNEIKSFMKENGLQLDTYDLYVNGEQLYKQYTKSIYDESGNVIDQIQKIVPFIRKNSEGIPFYWGWYGVSKLEGMLKFRNVARGIRLRCKNIQLGDETNCRRFLPGKQDQRFCDYFFGEIHTLSDKLIPDTDRNYLRVDDARTEFEQMAIADFAELKDLCYAASGYKSDYKKIITAQDKKREYEKKKKNKEFASQQEYDKALADFEKSKVEADKAKKNLEKRRQVLENGKSPLAGILQASYDPDSYNSHPTHKDSNNSYEIPNSGDNIGSNEPSDIDGGSFNSQSSIEQSGCFLRTSKPIYKSFGAEALSVINAVYKVIGDIYSEGEFKEKLIARIEEEITK